MKERETTLMRAKVDLEGRVADFHSQLEEQEATNATLMTSKRHLENENNDLKNDLETIEGTLAKVEREKQVCFIQILFIQSLTSSICFFFFSSSLIVSNRFLAVLNSKMFKKGYFCNVDELIIKLILIYINFCRPWSTK